MRYNLLCDGKTVKIVIGNKSRAFSLNPNEYIVIDPIKYEERFKKLFAYKKSGKYRNTSPTSIICGNFEGDYFEEYYCEKYMLVPLALGKPHYKEGEPVSVSWVM